MVHQNVTLLITSTFLNYGYNHHQQMDFTCFWVQPLFACAKILQYVCVVGSTSTDP